jgi:hypothetical protein
MLDRDRSPSPVIDTTVALTRPLVALLLIAGGLVWAIARGLTFYGLSPSGLYDDIAQPPLLLVLVGAWFAYRSRRRCF